MKKHTILLLIGSTLLTSTIHAQGTATGESGGGGGGITISLGGDSNTEQAAKLELIRILQERMNKMMVANMNARIVVSQGVANYYKVAEIRAMYTAIYGYRSKYATQAGKMGISAGNTFVSKYSEQYNDAVTKGGIIRDQLLAVTKSGMMIQLPAMPIIDVVPQNSNNAGDQLEQSIQAAMNEAGVHSEEDWNKLTPEQQAAVNDKVKAANKDFFEALRQQAKDGNKKVISIIGNVVGAVFGVPNAGTMLVGLASGGGAKALAGLVGNIIDNFQIPADYYSSATLKLTDSERIKMIDELHVRMGDLYQQVQALGANMSSEMQKRSGEVSDQRNELILYGPKK